LNGGLGPINIPINFGGPGVGNTTSAPSSGFFNSGQGSVSGFGNVGTAVSGFWNQVPETLSGAVSGSFNVGQFVSGMSNWGNAISGYANTSSLGLMTAAFDSGVRNIGQKLSGFFTTGTGP